MKKASNVLNILKNIASRFRLRKKRNRNIRSSKVDRGSQPVFTSSSAVQNQRRDGILSTMRSWFQRPARRKELKRTAVAVKNRRRGILAPAALLVFIILLVFLVSSPLVNAVSGMKIFRIQEISITGCRMTTPAMIRELAGISYQASLLRLDPARIEAILRMHPWIAAAEVKRNWPHVVEVFIKEYAAEALIVQEVPGGRQLFYLDRSGVVFAPVEPGQDMDLPIITGLEAKGSDGHSEMISSALVLLKLVRQNNPNLPLQNLSEIHVDGDAGMIIYLADYPFPIYFGLGAVRTKYSRLKRVLEVLYKETEQGMTIADVEFIRMDYLENKVLVARSGSG